MTWSFFLPITPSQGPALRRPGGLRLLVQVFPEQASDLCSLLGTAGRFSVLSFPVAIGIEQSQGVGRRFHRRHLLALHLLPLVEPDLLFALFPLSLLSRLLVGLLEVVECLIQGRVLPYVLR